MNASGQAQKGLKTFILTLSIALLVFSVSYYLISANKNQAKNTKTNSAVQSSESPDRSTDSSKDMPGTLETDSKTEEVTSETDSYLDANEEQDTAQVVTADSIPQVIPADSNAPQNILVETADTGTKASIFGGLSEQSMNVQGRTAPPQEAVLGDSSIRDEIQVVFQDSQDSKSAMQVNSDLAVKPAKKVSTETLLPAQTTDEPSASGTTSQLADVPSVVEVEPIVASSTVMAVTTEPSVVSTEVTGEFETTQGSDATQPKVFAANVTGTDPNIGGVTEAGVVGYSSSEPAGEVLAGSTSETTQSAVPDTGVLSMSVGFVFSLLLFIAAVIWIYKDPRRMAIEHFEKELTKGSGK